MVFFGWMSWLNLEEMKMRSKGWKEELIECNYCPCRFFTQTDFESHMKDFGDDPAEHLRSFMSNKHFSSENKRALRIKYLESR